MVGIALIIVGVLAALIVVPALISWFFWEISFNNKALIAKQTGQSIDDVVWIHDKFKVRMKNGQHVLIFRNQLSQSQSFAYDVWTKFFRKQSVKIDSEKWKTMNLSKKLQRGLFLYQTSEGEFHPMTVSQVDGLYQFKILPQDNRAFIAAECDHINNITLSSRKQMFIYLGIITAFIILAVLFIIFIIYITEAAGNICGVAKNSFLGTAASTLSPGG